MMRHLIRLASCCAALVAPAVASAQSTPSGFIDFTFTGTVSSSANDTIVARNPDGSATAFSGDAVPDYRYRVGDLLTSTFRFASDEPALSNAACGGRFTLAFASQGGGGCTVTLSQVNTPFGRVGMGGTGGDAQGAVVGLELVRDATTGAFSVDMPSGSYSMRYVGVNPYYYDSATQTLTGPDSNACVDAFNCPTGMIRGTSSTMSFGDIPIAGDFGTVRPGYDVGYNAGSAGTFAVSGAFGFGSPPVEVPEPSMLLLFGGGAATIMMRRRKTR